MDAEGDARQVDAVLRAKVRHFADECRWLVEPQRAGWTCEGHLTRILHLNFQHSVVGNSLPGALPDFCSTTGGSDSTR